MKWAKFLFALKDILPWSLGKVNFIRHEQWSGLGQQVLILDIRDIEEIYKKALFKIEI